jgi:hypothetical protein
LRWNHNAIAVNAWSSRTENILAGDNKVRLDAPIVKRGAAT